MQDFLDKPFSPSRMSVYGDCALLFRYRTIDKLTERPSLAAFKGTLVHSVMEQLFDHEPSQRTMEEATALLRPSLDALLKANPEYVFAVDESLEWPNGLAQPSTAAIEALIEQATALTSSYFRLERPQTLMPAEREHHVEVTLESGLKIHGIIDRIERSPAGDIRISDYKTGKAPGDRWMDKYWFQMKFYALLLYRSEGVLARELRLLFLGNTQLARLSPTISDIEQFETEVATKAADIKASVSSGTFVAKPSRICEWCSFKQFCPEQGGTLLPLPYTPTAR